MFSPWGPSGLWKQTETILSNSTPFSSLKGDQAVVLMYALVEHLLPLLGQTTPKEFVHRLVATRYDKMESKIAEAAAAAAGSGGGGSGGGRGGAVADGGTLAGSSGIDENSLICSASVLSSASFQQSCSALQKDFALLARQSGGDDVHELVLSHLLELWAVQVAGPHKAHQTLKDYQTFRFA